LYRAFYNLKEQPFRLTPDPAFMCITSQHQEALAGLVYSACTRPGLMVLTGEAGTGKTTLLYALLDLLEKRRFVTALCTNPLLSREELFDFLMMKFAIPCSSSLKSRQLAALQETLLRNRADGKPSILIVDEAQRLSMELLEEIRLLLNMETPQEKLLQIIIVGQPELLDILHRPDLRQFKQRISCQCKLNPLTFDELREYIDRRMTQAGLPQQSLFATSVMQKIHEHSGGIPRIINSLCDAALRNGFALQSPVITAAIVDEAARELDLLPPSMTEMLRMPEPVLAGGKSNGHAAGVAGMDQPANGHESPKVPLESYAVRQKSLTFFGQLMDRWR
jgi:general secretion pathway protein A